MCPWSRTIGFEIKSAASLRVSVLQDIEVELSQRSRTFILRCRDRTISDSRRLRTLTRDLSSCTTPMDIT